MSEGEGVIQVDPVTGIGKTVVVMPDTMTLRDWFAGMALQGMIASGRTAVDMDYGAAVAYFWADAMLKGREKP